MGEKPRFPSSKVPKATLLELSKLTRIAIDNVPAWLDVVLANPRPIYDRRFVMPTASFTRDWKQIRSHLEKTKKVIERQDAHARRFFDLVVAGRASQQHSALQSISTHEQITGLVGAMESIADLMENSLQPAHSGRPAKQIGGKDWTEEEDYAAVVYYSCRKAGGRLSENRNGEGLLRAVLKILQPFSGVRPPAQTGRQLEPTIQRIDQNSLESSN